MDLKEIYNKNIFFEKKDLNFLLEWIHSNRDKFVNNKISPHRQFLTLNKKLNHPNLFFDIKKKILSKENIVDNYIDDFVYGDYIGYIKNGGKIHKHKDPTIFGYDHLRFNLFLSVPTKGGYPIYNGVTIPVKVGDYVRCNASKEYHECEIVEGHVPRIVLSYGIHLKQKIYQY